MPEETSPFDMARAVARSGVFLVAAAGSNRVRYRDDERLSEAFDKDSAPRPASIVALVQMVPGEEDETAGKQVVGLGLVRSVQGIAAGAVRTSISPILRFLAPIELEPAASRADSDALSPFYSVPLQPTVAVSFIETLASQDPQVRPWVERQLSSVREYAFGIEQARIEARDAIGLAASIADIAIPADALTPDPIAAEDEDLLQSIINRAHTRDLEEELLPLDMLRWDGELVPQQHAASMTVFTDARSGTRLAVFLVNKKPLEEELGVDLIYWDRLHDAYTFVQYKRLERVSTENPYSNEWVYRRRSELADQLDLMPAPISRPSTSSDWRMTETPFWFKFVRGDAGHDPDMKVLKGMYVPADLLRLAMDDGSLESGPRGGFRVTYDNTKYVGRGTFVQLVSRGLTGSTNAESALFRPVIQDLGQDRQLIIAVKDEWNRLSDPTPVDDVSQF